MAIFVCFLCRGLNFFDVLKTSLVAFAQRAKSKTTKITLIMISQIPPANPVA